MISGMSTITGQNHFFLWIARITRKATNGHMITNANHAGDVSTKGHHLGYLSSKIFDLFIDVLVLKFKTLISIFIFTFFLSCWFRTSAKERSIKLILVWIWCKSFRKFSTVFKSWLIDAMVSKCSSQLFIAIRVFVLPLSF